MAATAPPAFLTRRDIDRIQLDALRSLLAEVLPRNPFYGPKLSAAGITADIASVSAFLDSAPLTRKQELVDDQSAHPPYGTNLTYALDRYTRYNQTSGTSGLPLRWLDTNESWDWMVGNWLEVYRASGVGPGARIFFAFSFGPFLGFWTAFEAGYRLGCLCIPGGGMSSPARLRAILDNGCTVLCCTPTYAIRLGEVAIEEQVDLSDGPVRTIIVAGEPGAGIPATRQRMERLWPGAAIRDHHGMTEVGPVSYECPERAGVLHIIESSFIPEVIDPETGRRLAPGNAGELVLTNLGRRGSPLIRYRTGDLVEQSIDPVCACGRSDFALEGGILGRTDDMVVIRGVNVHATAVEGIVSRFCDVAEYRVEVSTAHALHEIALVMEPSTACADVDSLRHEIESALRIAFNLRVPVEIAPEGSLPRFEMKARRWIRRA
jgi:phenylacetate-CoA ligase